MGGSARVVLLASCIISGIFAAESAQESRVSLLLQQADAVTLQAIATGLSPMVATLASWNTSNLLCSNWYGVKCDPQGFVTSLNLSSMNLSGHLLPTIQNLTHLQKLDLSNNSLSGSMPSAALKSIPQLLYLDLSMKFGFGLQGNLSAIAGFPKLEYLALKYNQLTGNLSADLGHMQTLRHLDLTSANGGLPAGEIPLTFQNLINLQYISLASLGVAGQIPPIFGGMKGLQFLYLQGNSLGGNLTVVLEELNQISTLQELLISQEAGAPLPFGRIPANFGASWSLLRILDFTGLNLQGQLPASVGRMQRLLQLSLGNNALTGGLPAAIGNCTVLAQLVLNNNNLSGSLPSALSKLLQLITLDLSFNHLNDSSEEALPYIPQNLNSLALAGNELSAPIPQSWSRFQNLTYLDLHDNNFYGPVPTWLTAVAGLKYLDLSNNQLSNTLPSGWLSAATLFTDGLFNVSHNYLTGHPQVKIGSVAALPAQDNTTEDNNCFLNAAKQRPAAACAAFCNATVGGGCKNTDAYCHFVNSVAVCDEAVFLPPPPPPSPPAVPLGFGSSPAPGIAPPGPYQGGGKKSSTLGAGPITAIAAGSLLALLILGLGLACAFRRRPAPKKVKSSDYVEPPGGGLKAGGGLEAGGTGAGARAVTTSSGPDRPGARRLDLAEVLLATGGFSVESMIRSGGYGTVYRGVAPDGTKWAVKRTHMISNESLRDFENEVDIISTMSHRNLVKLLGYCQDNQEQILVYEYVPNGNLRQKLNMDPAYGGVPLTFDERLEIALGAARGLHYLHSFANMPIIHRDIKAANLMLDEKLQAKVVDFGLSKVIPLGPDGPDEEQHLSTRVAGTPGYLDPDYYRTFQVTTKSDVFSFGVVLFELITGKTAVMKHPDRLDVVALVNWALPHLVSGDVAAVADPAMGPFPVEAMNLLTSVALLCTSPSGINRPTMTQVVRRLEEAHGVTKTLPQSTSIDSSESEWRGVVMPGIPTGSLESSQESSAWAGSEL